MASVAEWAGTAGDLMVTVAVCGPERGDDGLMGHGGGGVISGHDLSDLTRINSVTS